MDDHALCELAAGLASRINNLAVATTGDESRSLLAQQDQLAKLNMAAIEMALDADDQNYQAAVATLKSATDLVDAALSKPGKVADVIDLADKAIKAVEKVVSS